MTAKNINTFMASLKSHGNLGFSKIGLNFVRNTETNSKKFFSTLKHTNFFIYT